MGVPIDESFSWKVGRQSFRTPGAWAEVRVKRDPQRGDEYCDILVGVRTEGRSEPHVHIGINRDMSPRFEEGRGRLHSMSRKVEDSNWGLTEDRTLMFKPNLGKYQLQVKLRVSEPERTVWVDFDETELSDRP
jgi:hypothetical protein